LWVSLSKVQAINNSNNQQTKQSTQKLVPKEVQETNPKINKEQ
jgi:hypothetical protein